VRAERSAETDRLLREYADYVTTANPVDPKRLAELHHAAVASAQRDYERALEQEKSDAEQR